MITDDVLADDTFFYNEQLKNYLLQAMAVFAGLKVRIGASETRDPRLITVPIHYAAKDRVVAAIKASNTQNKPLRVPCMSLYLSSISQAPQLNHGVGASRRSPMMPAGGLFPNDIKVIHQTMPVVYKIQVELAILVSNTDQHFQILEQILPVFNPSVQLQTSDDVFDWTRLSTIELVGVNLEQAYPSGTERRIITSTLIFEMPVYLAVPASVKNNFVQSVMIRIGQLGKGQAGVVGVSAPEEDILFELDQQNVPADKIFDAADIQIDK
jgi:hypothetical protein